MASASFSLDPIRDEIKTLLSSPHRASAEVAHTKIQDFLKSSSISSANQLPCGCCSLDQSLIPPQSLLEASRLLLWRGTAHEHLTFFQLSIDDLIVSLSITSENISRELRNPITEPSKESVSLLCTAMIAAGSALQRQGKCGEVLCVLSIFPEEFLFGIAKSPKFEEKYYALKESAQKAWEAGLSGEPALFKYPRTEHLLDAGGSGVSRDDLVMSPSGFKVFV